VGTLELNQLYPLRIQTKPWTLYDDGFFNFLEFESLQSFLSRYTINRNATTVYDYESYTLRGSSDQNTIDINMIMNVPTHQTILYIPGVW